jgi:hypothetical protein
VVGLLSKVLPTGQVAAPLESYDDQYDDQRVPQGRIFAQGRKLGGVSGVLGVFGRNTLKRLRTLADKSSWFLVLDAFPSRLRQLANQNVIRIE